MTQAPVPSSSGSILSRLDWAAIRSGASVCLVFAVPFSLAARWAADSRNNSGLAVVLTLGALAGFVIGSGVAAWVQRVALPLVHGVVTSAGTYVIAQSVFIAIRLLLHRDVRWYAALFNITPVLFVGVIGGLLGLQLQRKGWVPSTQRGANASPTIGDDQ
ncbi:MAG: hypothetical protein JWN99_249 [Ilumatobacteraceae bacterium]|nr:hypothetical protein [Ilumatobacteraceae bacterium]